MISSLDDRNQVPSREMAEFLCFKGMRASIVPRSGGIRPVEAAFNCLGVGGSLVLLLKQFFFVSFRMFHFFVYRESCCNNSSNSSALCYLLWRRVLDAINCPALGYL